MNIASLGKAELFLDHAIIVTVNENRDILYDGAMAVSFGRILEIGPSKEMKKKYAGAGEVIDCTGKVIFPGFINTHNHLFQTLLKGLGDDMVLKDWLSTMTFPAAKFLTPQDCYDAARLGIVEGIRSGMTTEVDYMYPHAHEGLSDGILKAYDQLGIRGVFGRGCMNTGEEFGVCREIMQDEKAVEKDLVRLIDSWDGKDDGRIRIWAAPAALWSNTEHMLRMLYDIISRSGGGLTVHVSETQFDRDSTAALHGCAGVECLEKLGMTGPNVLMVHCVHLTDEDITKAGEYDLKVSHCPVSNMYLASGAARIPLMLKNHVTVSLGVDGAASNNSQDMIELMKDTALLQKVVTGDPVAITAEKVLEMATIDGARAIGQEKEIGSLENGKRADFVIFDPYKSPKSVPMHNPVSTLVYSSSMENIESVAVGGRFLLRDGRLTVADERSILSKAQAAAEDLCRRGGITNRMEGHRWQK